MHLNRWLLISIAWGAGLGCYGVFDTTSNNNNNNNTSADGGGLAGDLPCDVATALSSCVGCHGPTPSGGAPISLASYADMTATASEKRSTRSIG